MTSAPALGGGWTGALGRPLPYGLLLALLLVAGLVRSWITTSRDSFQLDEAWHAAAGASYARTGDFRLNPEHPPLVKLWVGMALPEARFAMPAFRPMEDKEAERAFINEAVYRLNDPDVVQKRVRIAMLALSALMLLGVALSVRRVFGAAVSLAALALLVLDPSIVAHMPVVLTDLPLALLSSIVFLQASVALRTFRAGDLALLSLCLGLTLASKHSGIVPALGLALLAVPAIWLAEPRGGRAWLGRAGRVAAVFAGAYVMLWAFYGFRFLESPGVDPSVVTFNRPLASKIADLSSPTHRALLGLVADGHLLPRAYIWGLADILRAGIDGRHDSLFVLGKLFQGTTPWYTFPVVLLVKIPLGVLALAIAGVVLLARRDGIPAWRSAGLVWLGWGAFYLCFLIRGNSGYAGIRHALPVIVVAAVLAALAVIHAASSGPRWWRAGAAVALLGALVSAWPRMRPWEYYNELVGGSSEAWRYFADDGLDNSQRARELAAYYDEHVRGTGQRAYDYYGVAGEEAEARGLVFDSLDDPSDSDRLSGTVFMVTREMSPRPSYDKAVFRDREPVARFGNLMVFQGEFQIPWLRADRRWERISAAQAANPPDLETVAVLLEQIASIYPQDTRASFELGNLLLERGSPERARAAYQRALDYTPAGDGIADALKRQIEQLSRGEIAGVRPLRNPWLE
ncbi:tetratricopeptide repeat protein [Sorangium sp. So ce542]|uniref:tetratricopeptide repeat protein n=1 Tax=Sorangium sp. So ce542 TaxID=3133316 RepID=UPI003F5F101D